jgi:hypothetical protein
MIPDNKGNTLFWVFGGSGVFRFQDGKPDGKSQNKHNNSQRDDSRERQNFRGNHFEAHESEHQCQSSSEINETVHQTCQQEIKRPQAKNRADVRRINNERILTNRKDGWDRIHRERQVRDFNHDHGESKRREHPAAIHAHSEVLVVKFLGDRKNSATELHHARFPEIVPHMFPEKHARCRDQQEKTEDVQNEMKPTHQSDAEQDHGAAHDERANNSPHQYAVLCARWNPEMREDEHEHKNVVHAQGVLDEISGKKIEPVMWPFHTPDDAVKTQRDDHPQDAAPRRCSHAQFAAASTKSEQVDPNGDEHANVKGDPKPDARRHAGEGFMRKAVRQSQIARRADGTYTSQGHIYPYKWMLN